MSATNTLSARLIGAIFLERGLVTEEQLQSALALQVETKEHLGEILVQHFGVSRIELASVLAEQWAELERANSGSAGPSGTVPLAAVTEPPETDVEPSQADPTRDEDEVGDEQLTPRPLGAIFVEQGLVTDAELDQALETQRQGGEKLGEILVAQGSITRLQLASALAEQWTALRKIRPPSAAERQTPTPPATSKVTSPAEADRLHEAVAALEQRLRAAESAAAREPWREEITAATEGLHASLSEIEARLATAATRDELEAVGDMRTALDELKSRMETLAKSEPTNSPELLRRVETAAEAATAAKSSLDGAFESLSLRLADVESRVHDRSDITRLQAELEGLVTRVSELDGERDNSEVDELRGEVQRLLDEVSRRTAAGSEADPALANRVEKLTVQVDEIGAQLKGFEGGKKSKGDAEALRDALTAIAARVEKLEVGDNASLQELRRSLSELEARTPVDSPLAERLAHYGTGPDEIHALQERIDEIERQAAELAERNPELEEQVGTLAGRVQALEGNTVGDELAVLRDSVAELAARPLADPALAERIEQIAGRLDEATVATTQLDELRAQVDALARNASSARAVAEEVEAVRAELGRLDDLGTRLRAVESDASLESLRSKVAELTARPLADPALADRVEQIAARLEESATASTEIAELRALVESLAAETSGLGAIGADVEALSSEVLRLDELGNRLHAVEGRSASLEDLRSRLDALAARPTGDPDLVEQLSRRVEEVSESAREVAELREGLTALGHRLDAIAERATDAVPIEQIRSLADRLEALENTDSGNDLAQLRRTVEELAARPAGDAALAQRVEELARELEVAAGASPQLEALGARVGELARQANAAGGSANDVDELRLRLDELADRPTADAAHVEQLARRVDELASVSGQIDGLRSRLDAISSDVGAPAEDLAGLRHELAAMEQRLDSVGDGAGDTVPSGEITALAARLEALESGAGEAELDALRRQLDELATRPAADPALAERVEQLAEALESSVTARAELDELRARLDAADDVAAAERPDENAARIDAIERHLGDRESRDAALATRFDDVASRLASVDELPARIDALADQLGGHESGHAKGVRKSDLANLRNDLAEQFGSMEERFEELVAGARKDHESLEQKVEKVVAALTNEIGEQRSVADQRLVATEEDAVALRSEMARVHESADAGEAWRAGIEAALDQRVEKLGKRLARALPEPPIDLSPSLEELRAELDALAARVDGSDVVTAGELEALKAQFEERLDAQAGRTEEQVRTAEEALRSGLSSLGERLAETESTYLEAGEALHRSIERLGAVIVDEEGDTTAETGDEARQAPEPDPDPEFKGPFIAFVPNGAGYSLQELNGLAPVVGESVPVADRDGEFVVTRIGRSPLPLDRRRCAYLELRPGTLASADRVT